MSYRFGSRLGEQLYRLLPEVYRTRDKKAGPADESSGTEALAKYLDAHGRLLDLIHATLEQQLKDTLPESSQDWLLPYFAQLLATNILSPDATGKHAEVANAISWRQRKGTLKCVEEIAEAVGQMEVELQEGWKRVAMTPRIGMPLMPADAWDATLKKIVKGTPSSEVARHPGFPAAMVDLRRPSRAVQAPATNPAARVSSFGGIEQTWRQMNPHGIPCFPGSFDDVSRRTVDLRTPDAANGHYHHKRLLVYASPPTGFFALAPILMTWTELLDSSNEHLVEKVVESGIIRNRAGRRILITDPVSLEAKPYRIEGIDFRQELSVPAGGKLELSAVEADKVSVPTFTTDEPVLIAADCLFRELSTAGPAKLERCTILETAYLSVVEARDSILMDIAGREITGLIEYSRIPGNAPLSSDRNKLVIKSHNDEEKVPVTADPHFMAAQTALAARAVLSPHAPPEVCAGAHDYGEMGYYHQGRQHRPVCLENSLKFSVPPDGGYPLTDVVFTGEVTVTSGQLVLKRSALPALRVATPLNDGGVVIPSLAATDCLFQNLSVWNGLARLEYCTVMETTHCKHLQASDCIFVGDVTDGAGNEPQSGCLRYSRIPEDLIGHALNVRPGHANTNTRETPVFIKFEYCNGGTYEFRIAVFGEPGYGVLDPVTSDAVRFGAEDGGEMGAYHHKYYSLKAKAVLDKMREFLPVGIEPVLIPNTRLLHVPPAQPIS